MIGTECFDWQVFEFINLTPAAIERIILLDEEMRQRTTDAFALFTAIALEMTMNMCLAISKYELLMSSAAVMSRFLSHKLSSIDVRFRDFQFTVAREEFGGLSITSFNCLQ